MYHPVLLALLATLGTWFITSLGAACVLFLKSPTAKWMNLMLGFAAGVMIAASFWSLLEPAIARAESQNTVPAYIVATIGFLLGAVFMWLCDKAVSVIRPRIIQTDSANRTNRVMMLILAITLHNIPEGLAIGVAFGAVGRSGSTETLMGAVTIAVGIGLQNFPEGAAVSLPLRREGICAKKSFLWGQASALVEPIAGVIGALLVVYVETILPYALSFAAGAMILVAVHELIPESQKEQNLRPYFSTAGILLGFAVMMWLDVMLG